LVAALKTIDPARASQVIAIDELRTALDLVHKDVERSVSRRREHAIAAHNKATNIINPSFEVGDFVLVRRANTRGHKLRFQWHGPCRVTSVHGSLVYGITPLRGGKSEMLDLAESTEARYEVVHKILNVGQAPDGLFFQVQWEGLPDKRDYTWQPIADLYADMPVRVKEFLSTYKSKKNITNKIKHQLNLV